MRTSGTIKPKNDMWTDNEVNKLETMFTTWSIMADVPISERKKRHMLYNEHGEHLLTADRLAELFAVIQAEGIHSVRLAHPGTPIQPLAFLYYSGLPAISGVAQNGQD